jgi:hypothetical protein
MGGNIKLIKNDVGDDVVLSAILRWGFKIAAGIAIAVGAAGVIGAFSLLRKADKTIDAMEVLTLQVHTYIDQNEKRWDYERQIDAGNELKFDALKNRLTAIDKKVTP